MAANSSNTTKSSGHGKRNALIAAIVVVVAFIMMIVAFFLSRNMIFYYSAKHYAVEGDFASANELVEKSDHRNADILDDYVSLRLEINKDYPVLLSEYDRDKIKAWSIEAERICGECEPLGKDILYESENLSRVLSEIVACEEEYTLIRGDILEVMDVFDEINRLHTKGEDGKNLSFTLLEERTRLNNWSYQSEKILSFVSRIPGNENIYLANYMSKEALGEISEISEALDDVEESGYAETDLIRFSGNAMKKFPDIINGDDVVNLNDKETYEKFMYDEICHELVQQLAVFYIAEY